MFLRKSMQYLKVLCRMRVSRYREFPADTLLSLLSSLLYLLLNLAFWFLVNNAGFFVEGWSYGQLLVFVAFSELFFGLDGAIFGNSSRFWYHIYSGSLDVLLTRPQDPRVRFLMLNIDFLGIFTSFITFAFLLVFSGERVSLALLLLGVLFVLTADAVLGLIRFTLSYTAFWLGRMDAICELADALTWFNKYPLVIMPKAVRVVFKLLVPFYFFSTFSSELVLSKLEPGALLPGIGALLLCAALWCAINSLVWKRGLARYESING